MGKKIFGYGDFFCTNCGDRIEKGKQKCPVCGAWYSSERKYEGTSALGAGGIGWSDRVNDPRFAKYDKGYRKYSFIWVIALSIIIPTIMIASGDLELDKEGFTVIGVIIGVLWLSCLIFLFFPKGGKHSEWDGRVEDKQIVQRERKVKDDDGYRTEHYTEYIVIFRCADGSVKEEIYKDSSTRFDYFRVGDYVHFHNKKYLRAYEKYDKSQDKILFCAKCNQINDSRDNFCSKCGCPLLKGKPQYQPS